MPISQLGSGVAVAAASPSDQTGVVPDTGEASASASATASAASAAPAASAAAAKRPRSPDAPEPALKAARLGGVSTTLSVVAAAPTEDELLEVGGHSLILAVLSSVP